MTPALPLRDDTLRELAARVSVPTYDRSLVRPGVVHLSVGSFHRSHQAVYLDELARQGARDWGIVGVGMGRPHLRDALVPQDGLFTVVARGARGDRARVVGSLRRYLLAPDDADAVAAALADEATALVTLTITPAGYQAADGAGSALGYLVEALGRRQALGRAPFTVASCDNVPGNGDTARAAVVALARRRDPRLAAWIEERVEFPNSMVDRITPKATAADCGDVAAQFGVVDRWPVITEPFCQWILEDRFCNRRPPLDEVGVQLVDDVRPYALMKTRLLNACHCAIGVLGSLAGLRQTAELMRQRVFAEYVRRLMEEEVTPSLPSVPGIDLAEYRRTVLERLANPRIGDRLERLCRAGSSKFAAHVVPSLADVRRRGGDAPLLALALAGWFRYLRGFDDQGRELPIDDPHASRLQPLARRSGSDPRPLLSERALFGDLADDPVVVESLEGALVALESGGAAATVASLVARESRVAA